MMISKTNMKTNEDYYLQILTPYCMKLKMFMTVSVRIN